MKRNILVLVAVFIVALVAFLVYRSVERKRLSAENIHEFFWADSNLIDSIAVKFGTWTHLFIRDGQWQMRVDENLVYPAAAEDISNAIRSTNEMVLTDLISVNPGKQAKFTIDTIMGTIIEFYGRGEILSEFVLGRIGQDMTHTYVRHVGSDSVWLAKGRFSSIYTKPPSSWMDRQLLNYGPGELAEVRWQYPDHEVRLTRDAGGRFQVGRDPGFVGAPSDSAKAAQKFTLMSTFYLSAFQPPEREHEASFEKLKMALTVLDTLGNEQRLLFADDTTVTTRVFVIPENRPRPIGILFTQRYNQIAGSYEDLLAANSSGK